MRLGCARFSRGEHRLPFLSGWKLGLPENWSKGGDVLNGSSRYNIVQLPAASADALEFNYHDDGFIIITGNGWRILFLVRC